jgi:hypothetical protein
MSTHPTSTRIRRTVAVVIAGVAAGMVATIAVASDRGEAPSIVEQQVERAEIADWANEQQLTGLSPASLDARGRNETPTSRLAGELAAIADWANEQQLAGLSPASLQPTGG